MVVSVGLFAAFLYCWCFRHFLIVFGSPAYLTILLVIVFNYGEEQRRFVKRQLCVYNSGCCRHYKKKRSREKKRREEVNHVRSAAERETSTITIEVLVHIVVDNLYGLQFKLYHKKGAQYSIYK